MSRTLRRAAVTFWVLALSWATLRMLTRPAQADLEALQPTRPALPWVAPDWHPQPQALAVLPELLSTGGAQGPRLYARSAYLFDVESGEVLVSRAADTIRPVASLTKLVSALAMSTESPDLDQVQCVDQRFYPTRSGATSRFSTGDCYRGWDYLGAALVSSDNRGAYGMQVASGLPYELFLDRMNEVSADLGMQLSSWADPSGLEDENLSTARDMARAAVAVAYHPVLSAAATAPHWDLLRVDEDRTRRLFSTNRLVGRADLDILAAKTGYTDTAGYCFTAVLRTPGGRLVALSVLGAGRNAWRWKDVDALIRYADTRG